MRQKSDFEHSLNNTVHIPIIYFHSVSSQRNTQWYKSQLTVSTGLFETIVRYFSRKNYRFLFLDEYFSLKLKGNRGKCICITFDDGYLDNYLYAFPLLKKYGAKGTIFISPEYVDPSNALREKTNSGGFLSWEEMRHMEASGIVDIQSHTMTHSKVYSSDEIRDFHNPEADWLYPITNRFPETRPFYISDPSVKKLVPYGTPFFRESSAITTRQLSIDERFNEYCLNTLRKTNWTDYSFSECYKKIENRYENLKSGKKLVTSVESSEDYASRVKWEIGESKRLIQENLDKQVKYICWPHGDYNQFCIDAAAESGYTGFHAVPGKGPVPRNSFTRIGVTMLKNSELLSALRAITKVEASRGNFPFSLVSFIHGITRKKRSC